MKLVATAALLFASVYSSVFADVPTPPTGKTAPVTIAFTFTYDVGGFPGKSKDVKLIKGGYYKLIANTDTFYKELYSSILTTSQYGNTEFVTDLINNEYLEAGNWKLVYVEAYGSEMRGFFAVNKKTNAVVFIGGYNENGFPINLSSNDGSGYTENATTTRVGTENAPTVHTEVDSYNGVETYSLYFKPYNNSTTFSAYALLNSQGTSKNDYVKDTYTYTTALTTVTGIVGDDGDGTIIGGGLTIGGLAPSKDVSAFITAYNNAHSG